MRLKPVIETLHLADEAATIELAHRVAKNLKSPAIVFLQGDLGAGKTTFVRGYLRALGVQGAVKSPTYSLIESYPIAAGKMIVHHLDLYRLGDGSELTFLGFEELLEDQGIIFIEWPEKAADYLPKPTHQISLQYADESRYAYLEGCFS